MQRRAPSRSMLCRRKRNKNARRKDRSGTERVVRKPGSASETKRDRRILARHGERLDQGARRRTKVILAVCARERSGKAATAISRRRCCGQACISRSWLGVLKRRELQAATNWPYPRGQLPRQTLDFSLAFLRRIRHQPIPYERSSPILHHVCRLRSRSFRK